MQGMALHARMAQRFDLSVKSTDLCTENSTMTPSRQIRLTSLASCAG